MKIFIAFALLLLAAPSSSLELSSDNLQWRADIGINYHSLRLHEAINEDIGDYDPFEWAYFTGISVSMPVSQHAQIGSKLSYHKIGEANLTSFRAIDYQYALNNEWSVGGFMGAARYDFRTTAFGYHVGVGAFYRPATWGQWGVSLEAQFADKLARDKLHEDDLKGPNVGPDSFVDVRILALALNYYF
jgi:hypothetical protein